MVQNIHTKRQSLNFILLVYYIIWCLKLWQECWVGNCRVTWPPCYTTSTVHAMIHVGILKMMRETRRFQIWVDPHPIIVLIFSFLQLWSLPSTGSYVLTSSLLEISMSPLCSTPMFLFYQNKSWSVESAVKSPGWISWDFNFLVMNFYIASKPISLVMLYIYIYTLCLYIRADTFFLVNHVCNWNQEYKTWLSETFHQVSFTFFWISQ